MYGINSKVYTKTASKKPNPPVSKAVVGQLRYGKFRNIDPSSTPVSFYIKKTK